MKARLSGSYQLSVTIQDLSALYWLVTGFPSQLVCESALTGEATVLKTRLVRLRESITDTCRVPETLGENIQKHNSDSDIFPNISTLLQILITLPIIVAPVERIFSIIWRLKTWLRNKMTEERLSDLALLRFYGWQIFSVKYNDSLDHQGLYYNFFDQKRLYNTKSESSRNT